MSQKSYEFANIGLTDRKILNKRKILNRADELIRLLREIIEDWSHERYTKNDSTISTTFPCRQLKAPIRSVRPNVSNGRLNKVLTHSGVHSIQVLLNLLSRLFSWNGIHSFAVIRTKKHSIICTFTVYYKNLFLSLYSLRDKEIYSPTKQQLSIKIN